jgi:energy-coupling factor transport system ATP-binding protein
MPVEIKHVSHTYSPNSPFEFKALKDVSASFDTGKMIAVIGQTGSGKSTLVQHLNGLLLPDEGEITVDDMHIKAKEKLKNPKDLRKKVGLVFQFPEYQLFEETVEKDISFGPKNFGVSEEETAKRVREVLPLVGLDESFLERSPFELSGGQKRRVAIAGILVQDPSVLVLDEPAAGLDPQSATEMMELFVKLNKEKGKTVFLVSHDMDAVLKYTDEVLVMDHGKVKMQVDTKTFFQHPEWLRELNVNLPGIVEFKEKMQENGFEIDQTSFDLEQILDQVADQLKGKEQDHA